jgi:hypothetical protein
MNQSLLDHCLIIRIASEKREPTPPGIYDVGANVWLETLELGPILRWTPSRPTP